MNENLLNNPNQRKQCLNSSTKDLIRIVVTISTTVAISILSVIFFIHISKFSDEKQTLTGAQHDYLNGSLYFFAAITQLTTKNHFSSLYSLIDMDNHNASQTFNLDVTLSCVSNKETTLIYQNIPQTPIGHNELYTTWFPVYDHIIVEMMVSGSVDKQAKISLLVVKSTEKFANAANTVNRTIRLFALAVLLIFLLACLWFTNGRFTPSQIIAMISLMVLVISNMSFNHQVESQASLSKANHFLYLIFKGISSAINLVGIFTAACEFDPYKTENSSVSISISVLFIIAEAMTSLTTDSYIIANFFDNNGIVWVVSFISSSLIKVTMSLLSLHHLISFIIKKRVKRVNASAYLAGLLMYYIPAIVRSLMMASNGFQNTSINFFCDYVAQAFVSLILIQLAWPTYERTSNQNEEDLDYVGLESQNEPPMENGLSVIFVSGVN